MLRCEINPDTKVCEAHNSATDVGHTACSGPICHWSGWMFTHDSEKACPGCKEHGVFAYYIRGT